MDFFLHVFEHMIVFAVASVPLILAFFLLKVFNLPHKSITICLLLNLLVSIFFWYKLKDVYIVLYQIIPYISSFVWIWADSVLKKRQEDNTSKND